MACFHNPDVGRDARKLEPVSDPKEVLVAGAGPAGLKAAEIAARRGHRVTVYEEAQDLGGRLRHLRGTSPHALFESVTWLVGELGAPGSGDPFERPVDSRRHLENCA